MRTERIAFGVKLNRFVERCLATFEPPDDRFEFFQGLFKAEVRDFRCHSHVGSIDGARGAGQAWKNCCK